MQGEHKPASTKWKQPEVKTAAYRARRLAHVHPKAPSSKTRSSPLNLNPRTVILDLI